MTLPAQSRTRDFQYQTRNFQWDDLPAIANLWNRHYQTFNPDESLTVEDLKEYYTSPEIHAETDVTIITDGDNQIIGMYEIELSTSSGRSWSDGVVDPRYTHCGVGTHILHDSEATVLARLSSKLDENTPIAIQRHCVSNDLQTRALLEANGYKQVRSFFRMKIDLTQAGEIDAPPLPDGIELRPVQPEHYPAIYAAHQESFRDHWGWEPYPYEEWEHFQLKGDNADPSLWQIAWAGDEVASINLNRRYGEEKPDWAWVSTVGTRPRYRKTGLASALLRRSFQTFQARGFANAALGVDATNPLGAVAIYERAGMSIYRQNDSFAKMLRGDWLPIYPQGE